MMIGRGRIGIILLTRGLIFRSAITALLPVGTVTLYSIVATRLRGCAADGIGRKADNSMGMSRLTGGMSVRSASIGLRPVGTGIVYWMVATGLIGFAADWFGLKADNSMEMILTVVLYGV
ncbi:hypothetical protein VM98_34175, partial [Streptomyces rubellomurinus subsp. indigoferus]